MTPENHIDWLTQQISTMTAKLHDSIEMHEKTLEEIRQRDRSVDYLSSGWRRLEENEDGDTEVVSYHHNAGRQVLATVPAWAEGMGEHIMHAQDDIERLLAENDRLRKLADLRGHQQLRRGLKELHNT